MLQILKDHSFYANEKKCAFAQKRIAYLGHVITKEGVSADPEKVEAMKKWPQPKNVTVLCEFLGLTGYYRRFVASYGRIARSMTELLKKYGFHWSVGASKAFEQMKDAMCSMPVLGLPYCTKPFIVETDASGTGIGAVLSQGDHAIAYISKGFSSKGRGKSVYEQELLAIVFAVTKWRNYLTGHQFTIRTDQKSLRHLLEQRAVSVEQQKLASKFLGLNYAIEYRPGKENRVADALSRRVDVSEDSTDCLEFQLIAPLSIYMDELALQVEKDEALQMIIKGVLNGEKEYEGYTVENGVFLRTRGK